MPSITHIPPCGAMSKVGSKTQVYCVPERWSAHSGVLMQICVNISYISTYATHYYRYIHFATPKLGLISSLICYAIRRQAKHERSATVPSAP